MAQHMNSDGAVWDKKRRSESATAKDTISSIKMKWP